MSRTLVGLACICLSVLVFAGCATIVGTSGAENTKVLPATKNFEKCVIRVGFVRQFGERVQVRAIPEETFAINMLTREAAENAKIMGLCKSTEIGDVFERDVKSDFSVEGLKKFFAQDQTSFPDSGKVYLDFYVAKNLRFVKWYTIPMSLYYMVHMFSIGLIPFRGFEDTDIWAYARFPGQDLKMSHLEISHSLWSWMPLMFSSNATSLGVAEMQMGEKGIQEGIVEGLNEFR